MNRDKKLELIERALGIRHKLKVHESMKQPDTHEEIAIMTIAKWELEDELKAIEQILEDDRSGNVKGKKTNLEKTILASSEASSKKSKK
jgi:hypothetical protein